MSAALGVLFAGLAVGCGGSDSPYFGTTSRAGRDLATYTTNNGSEPEYLDPGKSTDSASSALIVQLFEGLTTYHPRDMHPTQAGAVRWDQSDDHLHYRFHLRPEARWSDGRPVTAFDYEYAWKRVVRPSFASRSATNLYAVKNAEAYNQGRLLVTRNTVAVRATSDPRSRPLASLPKGTVVEVTSPASGPGALAHVVERRGPTFDPDARPGEAEREPADGYVLPSELVENDSVLGVRAADALTLEVELEQPTPYFLELTSMVTLFPIRKDVVEAFEQRGEAELWVRPESIVTNGPYTLDTWKFRYEITMKASPTYYDADKLRIKRAVFLEVEDNHATMNLYKAGDLDTIGDNASLPSEYLEFLSKKKDFRRHAYLSTYWLELNTTKPPVNDVRVRKALNLAVDKQQLVDRITRGGQQPATHYVPEFTGQGYAEQVAADKAAGTDPFSTPDTVFNPTRARALMKEAGYEVVSSGEGYRASGFPPLELLYNTSEGHRQIAVAIQDMWKRHLGVSVTLRNEEWKVMLKNVRDGNFQIVRFGWVADYNHPHTWLDTFLSYSPNNRTGFNDPEYDALIKRAAAEPDAHESIRLYRQAELRAVQAMPKLPLYFYTKSTLVKPWVKGHYGLGRDVHLVRWLWIDPDWATHTVDEPAYVSPDFPPPGRLGAALGATP
jgi:oligopeptide transport system substrate-binding protein